MTCVTRVRAWVHGKSVIQSDVGTFRSKVDNGRICTKRQRER